MSVWEHHNKVLADIMTVY